MNWLKACLLIFLGLYGHFTRSQTYRYTTGVTESGVYQLSGEDAKKLGFQRLEEVAFYGYPGMLPQRLDPSQLEPQEIPSWIYEDQLYVYLEGPHQGRLSFGGELDYSHHLYTDTLRYVLAQNSSPKRIAPKPGNVDPAGNESVWYKISFLKEEKLNLLNSGRTWYSLPIRQGQTLAINFGLSSETNLPWLLHARLMSQSNGASNFRIWSDDELLQEVNFSPIPTGTYGIKGIEQTLHLNFAPKAGRLDQLRFSFQGPGTGHLDVAAVGIPFSNTTLKEGLYFGKSENSIALESGRQTWEVSDFFKPLAFSSGKSATGKKWFLFYPKKGKALAAIRAIASKSEQTAAPELLVITVPQFKQVAQQLQAFKNSVGIPTQVVFTTEIYDWMGYGNPDVTAIRNFIAQEYHQGKELKNVLILGKGTFDYKKKLGGRPNLVPIYTSRSSLDPLTSFSSDDYYGMVNWGLGEWEEERIGDASLQLGVGRIPAITLEEAKSWLEKNIAYEIKGEDFPSTTLTFVADDGDLGVHIQDSEAHSNLFTKKLPFFRTNKLYLDRFEQTKNGNVQEALAAKKALLETLNEGTLLLNYVGHGNETTLTAEEIFRVQDLENWPSQDQLPIWFTATCEFGRHDSPFIRSGAEELLFARKKGAIGLLATGRPVFSSVNFTINQAFIQALAGGGFSQPDLGSLYRQTKNQSLNGPYNRNFSLFGDPSLRVPLPESQVALKELLLVPSQSQVDSIRPLAPLLLRAKIQDPLTGSFLSTFQGKFILEIWNQADTLKTLGDENPKITFTEENERLFLGEGNLTGGELVTEFLLPEFLSQKIENLSLRIHAWDPLKKIQATGIFTIPFSDQLEASNDQEGPTITVAYAGKQVTQFPVISTTQAEVTLLFQDQSGINSSSLVPDRIMHVRINQGIPQPLNAVYRAVGGSFQNGTATVLLTGLTEGKNEVQVVAWDNVGNPGSISFTIEVRNSNRLRIISHQIFPNPVVEKGSIRFQHNRPNENLVATWTLYSSAGQILFSEEKRFIKAPEVLEDWDWIFLLHKSKYTGKGTYIYKLTVRSESSSEADSVSGKLVIQ